jgi:ElaB/YqjD/DUF883 family membrane-anchored ribosome-binding protein
MDLTDDTETLMEKLSEDTGSKIAAKRERARKFMELQQQR